MSVVAALAFFVGPSSPASAAWKVRLVKDIRPGEPGSLPRDFEVLGHELLFAASERTWPDKLWRSDGTRAGTKPFANVYLWLDKVGKWRGRIYFSGEHFGDYDSELWTSDGTRRGTHLLKDINRSTGSSPNSDPSAFTPAGGRLFFSAYEHQHGRELWSTDGTRRGTHLVRDVVPGGGGSLPSHLTNVGGTLFFRIEDPESDVQLWASDGTEAGTRLVYSFPREDKPHLSDFAVLNGQLVFHVDDGKHGVELWSSDGTATGTELLKDINPGTTGSEPRGFRRLGRALLFSADDGIHGYELWRTNGTPAGTRLVKDVNPGSSNSGALYLGDGARLDGNLFFVAGREDGTYLWRTDGSGAGTNPVKLLAEPPSPAFDLTRVGNTLFFDIDDGRHGYEPWVSDGTPGGTHLLKNINPGPECCDLGGKSSYAGDFVKAGRKVLFRAHDEEHGSELWVARRR